MKLARFGDQDATGIVISSGNEDHVLDVRASVPVFRNAYPAEAALLEELLAPGPGASWVPLIDRWDDVIDALEQMQAWATAGAAGAFLRPLEEVRLRAPTAASDAAYFTLGGNFADHAARAYSMMRAETVDPDELERDLVSAKLDGFPPWGALILPRLIVGPSDIVSLPVGATKLDYEAEVLTFVRSTLDGPVIWGITAWNDLSIRDPLFQLRLRADETLGMQHAITWALTKNFHASKPVGPWVSIGEIDLGKLTWTLTVNGELRQDSGATARMIYSFDDTIGYLSQFLPLRSGDGITSGTGAGTALEEGVDGPFLVPGDVVEVHLSGLGTLRTPIGETGATWPRVSRVDR